MIRKKAVIITFTTKTDKNSDRTKFFKQLYGWEQTIPGKKKNYEYHREGFLEKIRHKKVAQSSFIVPENEFDKIMEFFEQWHKKVITNAFKIILEDEDIFKEFDRQLREMDEDETEGEEPDESEESDENEGLSEEEEEQIIKRHREWQKRKAKYA
jgi:hypothetical protein